MASRLQDVILRGLAADRPLATDVAPGTLYYSTDVATTERSDGTTWETYTDSASGGVPGLHVTTHEPGGTDPLTVDAVPATGSLRTLGTGANQAAAGDDARFSVPALHAPTHSLASTDPVDVTDLAGFPGGGTTFLRDDATFVAVSGGGAHAATHSLGGGDDVDVTDLAGYPGGATTFLRDDATFSALPVRTGSIELIIDGGASVITTGVKGYLEVPFACTITAVTLLADLSGSIVIDIWKDTYANYPPVVADTITAAAKPTISAALKSQDTTLTGWTTSVSAGDVLGFNVDSVTTITKVTLSLKIQVV